MAENKNQHYVPKFYMKNFSKDNNFNVLIIDKNKIINNIPFDDQCKKEYFYGDDLKYEKILSKKENCWGTSINKVINKDILNDNDKYNIKEFAVWQHQRTLFKNKQMKKTIVDGMHEVLLFDCKNKNISVPDNSSSIVEEAVENKFYNDKHDKFNEKQILDSAADLVKEVLDLQFLFVEYKTKRKIISSDNPVLIINKLESHSIGLNNIGILIMCPLSPQILLVLYDGGVYTKYKNCTYIEVLNEDEVTELNKMQYIQADKIIYSIDNNSLIDLSKLENKREDFYSQNNVMMLSGLMGFHEKRNYSQFEFSFGDISHSFKRIPFHCKDSGIPRKCEKGWFDRVHNRETMMISIPMTKNMILEKMSLKEFKCGCQRYTNAIENYWRSNNSLMF